jgi:hypothetical protein
VRLPWPFHRRTPPSSGSDTGSSSSADPGGSASGLPLQVPRPTAADGWPSLPPIQRAIAAPPLVAPTRPLLDAAPGVRPLPPIVQPLGHDVSPTAPAGLVVARTVATLASETSLPPVWHGPIAAGPVSRDTRTDVMRSSQEAAQEPAVPSSPSGSSSEAADASPEGAGSAVPDVGRSLGVVPATSAVRPSVRPLTSAGPLAPAGGVGPVVARVLAGTSDTPRAQRDADTARTGTSRARAGLGEPLTAVPARATDRPASLRGFRAVGPSRTGPKPDVPAVQRRTDGSSPDAAPDARERPASGDGSATSAVALEAAPGIAPDTTIPGRLPALPVVARSRAATHQDAHVDHGQATVSGQHPTAAPGRTPSVATPGRPTDRPSSTTDQGGKVGGRPLVSAGQLGIRVQTQRSRAGAGSSAAQPDEVGATPGPTSGVVYSGWQFWWTHFGKPAAWKRPERFD